MKYIRKKSGETLVEAIVSLTILIITTAVASSTVIYAMQSVALSRNYLVAQNLGDETIEIVKNIRNTNAMISSTDIDACWTVINPDTNCSDPGNKLADGATYIPKLDSTSNRWILVSTTTPADFQVYKKLVSSPGDPEVYVYTNDSASATATNYYRHIKVTGITEEGGVPVSILIEVKVWWYGGSKYNELKGVTLITNHE